MCNSGIYKIINIKNNKYYLGSSINFHKRWKRHINTLNSNTHHNINLQRAWNKYGSDNFKFQILECIDKKYSLKETELYYLNTLKPFGKIGYNIAKVADGGDNLSLNPNRKKIIQKMSIANKKKWQDRSEEFKENDRINKLGSKNSNWRGGISKPKCTCGNQMSYSAKICKECYNKVRINPCKGKIYTEAERKNLSDKAKGVNRQKSKRCIFIHGKKYDFIADAARDLKINYGNVLHRLKSTNYTYKDYNYENVTKNIRIPKKKHEVEPFMADGLEFNNLKTCAEYFKTTVEKIHRKLIAKKYKEFYYKNKITIRISNMKINKDLLSKHTFLKLNPKKGYSNKQCSEAMQLMEINKDSLTVKCKDGCLSKPYEHFEIISPNDYSKFKIFHIAPYFENNLNNIIQNDNK